MANIKISELNEITTKANNDVLAIVDTSADETKKIKVEDLLDKNIELIAVSDTAPSECSVGDRYFDTTTNLIYTATGTDTWGVDGEEPIEGIFYIVFNEQSSYAYDGTTLVSVGGGTEDIVISDTEPTDEGVKIWIDTGEVQNLGSEVHIGDTIDSKIGLNILKGKNLIDLSSMLISGGYSDTGYVASSNYITIQYIQVKPNTTYTLSTNLSTSKYTVLRIVDFDNNKTIIRRSGGTALASSNTFTTSSDAYYLALCFYTGQTASINDITQAQLEQGSTATTYQAYITPAINVYGEDIYSKPVVLWINSETTSFVGQTITLNDNINNYSYYEVIYRRLSSGATFKSSGRIHVSGRLKSDLIDGGFIYNRTITSISGTSITFGDAQKYETYGSNTSVTANNVLIPYQIIGYK